MKFCYHRDAGLEILEISGDLFRHLYSSRRTSKKQDLDFCNLLDEKIYTYTHLEITKKSAKLKLVDRQNYHTVPSQSHIIWAITESKIIQHTLPFLNQLNVAKLTLFYAMRSQRNEKVHPEKLEKILIQSCEQCGRNTKMEITVLKDLASVLQLYPNAYMLDFDGSEEKRDIYPQNGIIIGPEGGFSPEEKLLFTGKRICLGNLVLKSECAAISAAALTL